MPFEGNLPLNQLPSRVSLCKGQPRTPSTTERARDFKETVRPILKEIESSKLEPRDHFKVFNASVQYFQMVRPLLQPGLCIHVVPSLRQVVQSLEEVDNQDRSWRAELMIHLIECLVDSGKTAEAAIYAKAAEEFIKLQVPQLYRKLFLKQVQHKLADSNALIKISKQCNIMSAIYKVQEFKDALGKTPADRSADLLQQIFQLVVDRTNVSTRPSHSSLTPIQPTDRVAFLLELVLLALQVGHQKVAANYLKELKSGVDATAAQRVVMECVNCEISLLKRNVKMNDYSKAGVEARLKEIGKLDQWLQDAVREGDRPVMQAVCATQWNLCLPLLQHNLRKRIRTPLCRVAQVLEDIQSMFLEMRCQIHSELALIEEEDGVLHTSLTHLQKALQLDDGSLRERLLSALSLVQLKRNLNWTLTRAEDKAAMLLLQTREVKPQEKTDARPTLVDVGLLLAPDGFQTVLDADDVSKIPEGFLANGPMVQLSSKAQHHSTCVVDGVLARHTDDKDNMERLRLWVTLAKTARKQEVWDVCRAACRFCLPFDDKRPKSSKTNKCKCLESGSCAECPKGCRGRRTEARDSLQLLAEIHFINAEATIQKLLTEGVPYNSPPVLDKITMVSEADPNWVIYRDWIQGLSAYATSSFLRAAELGAEVGELWLQENAAVYLWNYSSKLLAVAKYQWLLPAFQGLVEVLQKTEYTGHPTPLVLLCDTVARGLIQRLIGQDQETSAQPADKGKSRGDRGTQKSNNVQADIQLNAMQNVQKAQELLEYALHLSSCSLPGRSVPIAGRKQVVATWVQTKRLLEEQVDLSAVISDECTDEDVAATTCVLVGVEMLQCNKEPKHMEFSVPSLATLVSMAAACSWCDPVVEMQVWCQLADSCSLSKEGSLVLVCTEKALSLEEAAAKDFKTKPCVFYGPTAVNEMLCTACSLRGLALVHKSSGELHVYREAIKMFQASISFAEKVENPELCLAAVKRYWNACLPLTRSPEERGRLHESLEKLLMLSVLQQSKVQDSLTSAATPPGAAVAHEETNEEVLFLKAAIYSLLLQIHTDKADRRGALKLLDQATKDLSGTTYHPSLVKQRILLKAQLGENVALNMQKLQKEGEQCCSRMWQRMALCVADADHRLICYQKAVTLLEGADSWWMKVRFMLEFGEVLYNHNYSKAEGRQLVQWAVDVLLQEHEQVDEADESKREVPGSKSFESVVGVQGSSFTQSLSKLKEVQRLDSLVRAHMLLSVMSDKSTPECRLNLIRAYTFVLRIWQVSMEVCHEISVEMTKSPSSPPPSPKKGKGKAQKPKDPADDKPDIVVLDREPPSSPKDWALFVCPELARHIFKTNTSPHCINKGTILNQMQSLYYLDLLQKELCSLALDHLKLPVMHLAEVIALDLLGRSRLSELYRLRIIRTCSDLSSEIRSPYEKELVTLSKINEQEQIESHKEIILRQTRSATGRKDVCQDVGVDKGAGSVAPSVDERAVDIWLEKAEVFISMGLYEPARHFLAEAHRVSVAFEDQKAEAKSLLGLATLACEENNRAQALILLDRVLAVGGDEEFWYKFTLTKVKTVATGRHSDAYAEVNGVIKQGCEALKLLQEKEVNRRRTIGFLIISLEMSGADEYMRSVSIVEHKEKLHRTAVQRLKAAVDTLKECAVKFAELSCREQAIEAHHKQAQCLRILANHTSCVEDKQRFLLDGLKRVQRAVTEQEHVVLNSLSLLPSQEERGGLSLGVMQQLLRLRLALVEFCLAILEEQCAEKTQQVLARKRMTTVQIALMEFTCCTPESESLQEEWMSVGHTLVEMTLGQLTAMSLQPLNNMETRVHFLSLMGKFFKLLAVQEDPLCVWTLWHLQTCSDLQTAPAEELDPEAEIDIGSSKKVQQMTSTRICEQQKRRIRAQQLLAQAHKALDEAIRLSLKHALPAAILADASLNLLECAGQSSPALAGQHLALYQSCCATAAMAEVLTSACADTCTSQLSALLTLRGKLQLSAAERPNGMLKRVEDSLNALSKAFSHLSINPNHPGLLAKLPSNMRILLLQHSKDGSKLYGALYELPTFVNQRNSEDSGALACSRVARVSVCPQALLALREQSRAFGSETWHALLKRARWQGPEVDQEAPEEQQASPKTWGAEELTEAGFRNLVGNMENYLNPLLRQLDVSFSRPQHVPPLVPEVTKGKDKEEKGKTAKSPVDPGEYVVLLADMKLLELPLEALSILQEESLFSVSRDFSLQLLCSHLKADSQKPEKVESDNKKETKGGKATKGKADQSPPIKAAPATHVDNLKYFLNPHHGGSFGMGMSATDTMEIFKKYNQRTATEQTCSLSELEQLLCTCNGFVYLAKERLTAKIPPVKLVALNLSECHLALLFDLVLSDASAPRRSNPEKHKRQPAAPEGTLDTALLLSLGGVSCLVFNQWHSDFHQNAQQMDKVVDNLLKSKHTSGQAIHALRKEECSDKHPKVAVLNDQEPPKEGDVRSRMTAKASAFSCVLYGAPNLTVS
ncbi:cilia- and flagella-associated protein 46 isoform X3 [Nelusetta ayraudi]|uniref:cilia- and flagella-associated protein 46 isoform X3 n=1 Tax=Nelusetta ayraudi TaxID=303726 RepID=UPI003F6FB830